MKSIEIDGEKHPFEIVIGDMTADMVFTGARPKAPKGPNTFDVRIRGSRYIFEGEFDGDKITIAKPPTLTNDGKKK